VNGPTSNDDIPDWVMSSVMAFLAPFFQGAGPDAYAHAMGYGSPPRDFVREVERNFQVRLAMGRPEAAKNALWAEIQRDRTLLVKVLDYALANVMMGYEGMQIDGAVGDLTAALRQGGANFVVVQPDSGRLGWRLERRTTHAAVMAVSTQVAVGGNASIHLDNAWRAAFGREPNPTNAYSEAVKAVEAAAKPLVLPNDDLATLGKIVGQLCANPQKYTVALARSASPTKGSTLAPIEVVTALADLLWTNQTDRHAAGDPEPAVPVTQQQAEAATHLAVTLVHIFREAARTSAA
jgi:hypothetical protein